MKVNEVIFKSTLDAISRSILERILDTKMVTATVLACFNRSEEADSDISATINQ